MSIRKIFLGLALIFFISILQIKARNQQKPSFEKECSKETITLKAEAEKVCGRRNFKARDIMIKRLKEAIKSSENLCSRDELSSICCFTLQSTVQTCESISEFQSSRLQERVDRKIIRKMGHKL